MDMFGSGPSFAIGLVLGTIGFGYFSYGRKLQRAIPKACGIGLMIFPYFVSNLAWLVVVGCVLGVVPWLVRA